MAEETQVIDAKNEAILVPQEKTANDIVLPAPQKVSPAQDLRNLQMLLVSGIFPGNVAPQIIAGYNLLERMASEVEKSAAEQERASHASK